jgi:hypothetical protein
MQEVFLVILIVISFIFLTNFFIKSETLDIDAVITYVNDTDPIWIKQKNSYKSSNETINARKKWRFQSNNEIKYCLKCIEKNSPFFRNIFIVIAIPSQKCDISFLSRTMQNKIKFITHQEFYYNKEHLPTFNSMSIEHNIHNIANLSEYFVYFNDDCFINTPIKKDYFVKNDKIIVHKEDTFVPPRGTPDVNESGFFSAWKNTNKMLDNIFPETKNDKRFGIKHVPQIQIKKIHKTLKEMFPTQFEATSSSKFRNTKCNLMSAGLAEYYSLYTNLAIEGTCNRSNNCNYLQVFVSGNKEKNMRILELIKKEKPTLLNIQSAMKDTENFDLEEIYKEIFNF